jgi:hypothetical protein
VVVAAAVGVFAYCRPRPAPLPPAVQFSVDSNRATRPVADSTRHATSQAVATVITKIVRDEATIAKAQSTADAARARADSLAQLAAASDANVALWKAAYASRTDEAKEQRQIADSLRTDLDAARDTLVRAATQLRADSTRFVADGHLIDQLEKAAKDGDHCRILWVLGCPSRTASFVGGVAGGVAGDELVRFAVRNRAKLGINIAF